MSGEKCELLAEKHSDFHKSDSVERACFSTVRFPFGEAAFNQRLSAARSDPRRGRLIKFLPLQTVAEREKPLSCNLVSAQEVSRLEREKNLRSLQGNSVLD